MCVVLLPDAAVDFAEMRNAQKLVGRRCHVQVTGFLVGEERVRHPNVFQVFRADHDALDARQRSERQTRILPILAEVEIRREILKIV